MKKVEKIKKYIYFLIAFVLFYKISFHYLAIFYNSYPTQKEQALKAIYNPNEIMKPKSGRQVLNRTEQIVTFAIDTLKIKDFKFYGKLNKKDKAEEWYYISATNWPCKLDTNSKNLIGYAEELSKIPGVTLTFNYEDIGVASYK